MVDYKFILEVARHGARSPSILYDLTAPGQANFAEPMKLTSLGAHQHYTLGDFARERYFAGKTMDSMASAGVYA